MSSTAEPDSLLPAMVIPGDEKSTQAYAEARRKALEWMGEKYLLANPVTRLDQPSGEPQGK